MREIKNSEKLNLVLFVGASALLDKFGEVIKIVEEDGFKVNEKIYTIFEGENLITMAKSAGMGLIELPSLLHKYSPDFFLIVGDRFEMLTAAIAALYMNIPIVHTMGGELSGTVDEIIRHAITKISHVHFPANELARKTIIQMGENEEFVFNVGCPRIDSIKEILETDYDKDIINQIIRKNGVGSIFDINNGFLLVSQHPVTTEFGLGEQQITNTLNAVSEVSKEYNYPVIMLWPNVDAGSDHISRGIRKFRERGLDKQFHFFKNLPLNIYIWLMDKTACLIGNSSSGIREGAFIGTPVVNIGTRQSDRARGKNVIDVSYNSDEIKKAIITQIKHGKYPSDPIYGTGNAAKKIVSILENIDVNVQKKFYRKFSDINAH